MHFVGSIFLILVVLIFHECDSHRFNACEASYLAKCNERFVKTWKSARKGEDTISVYCKAFKVFGRCLGEDSQFCSGKVLDLLREGFRQHMVFNMRTNVCPYDMAIRNLKELVKEYLPVKECDIEVNDYCARKTATNMLRRFKQNACMAEEVDKRIIECFESKEKECDGPLFRRFLSTLKKVGNYVMFSQTQKQGLLSNCKKIRPPPAPIRSRERKSS